MALIFSDGFDSYGVTADFTKKDWINNDVTDITFLSSSGKFGGGCVQILDDPSNGFERAITFNEEAFRIAFWMYIDSGITVVTGATNFILRLENSAAGPANWEMNLNASGLIEVTEFDDAALSANATSSTDLRDSTWHHIELNFELGTFATADGTIELWVDGVKEIDEVANNTNNLASGETLVGDIDRLQLNPPGSSPAGIIDYRIDDFMIWDDTGTAFTSTSGVHRIETLRPTAEGNTTQFTPSSGTDNSALIDEAGADDADYVESATTTNKDTNAFGNLSSTPSSIKGVVVNTRVENTDIGSISFKEKARSGTTEADGTTHLLTNSFAHYQHLYDDDPDTAAAWTGAGVNAAEFGYEVV